MRLPALLLLAAIAAADEPAEAPGTAARLILEGALGPEALDILERRGYVVLQGKHGERRVEWIQEGALKALAERGAAALELSAAHQRFLAGQPVAAEGAAPGFVGLADLPAGGLVTPRLHALRLALAASHEERAALSSAGKALSLLEEETLFERYWGERFSAQRQLEAVSDPSAESTAFFRTLLTGLRRDSRAGDHLADYVRRAYDADIGALLEGDRDRLTLSDELRGWIGKYLVDQRRLHSLRRLRRQARSLEDGRKRLARDLAELRAVAESLQRAPDALGKAREALARKAPAQGAQVSSVQLFAQKPQRLERFDPEDQVAVSGGYWIDGAAPGEAVGVEETLILDRGPLGIEVLDVRHERRRNGGPYGLSRAFTVPSGGPLTFRVLLGLRHARAKEASAAIPVSDALAKAQGELAKALALSSRCELAAADEAHERLEKELEGAAAQKKPFRRLVEESEIAHRRVRKAQSARERLEKLLEESKEDLDPARCAFDPKRTDRALELARDLPPGCAGPIPELLERREILARRADDQRYVLSALERGKVLRRQCDFAAAEGLWAGALAVLDAHPEARCGETEAAASWLEAELPKVRLAEDRRGQLLGSLAAAEKAEDRLAAAAELRGLMAAAEELPEADCLSSGLARAGVLSRELVGRIPAPDDEAAARVLPPDAGLAVASRDVESERLEIEADKERARTKRVSQQERPTAAAAAPAAEPAAPEPEPVKISPKVDPKKRLSCLEKGIRSSKKALDCHGKPFQVAELKALRQTLKRSRRSRGKP